MKHRLPWDAHHTLPKHHRLDHVFPPFEAEEDAWREDGHRMIGLRVASSNLTHEPALARIGFDPDDISGLDERLTVAGQTGVHCGSMGSSVSMRNLRLSLIGGMFGLFEAYSDADLIFFTLLNERWVLTAEQLAATSASDIRNQLRRHLVRAGVNDIEGPLVGFLHGEYDPIAGVYILHFHGITLKTKKKAIASLSGRWGYVPTASNAPPIVCLAVRNRETQFSYCLKSYWLERAVKIVNSQPERDGKGCRIGEPYQSFALTWLDRHSPSDITLLMGCRVGRGGQLVEHGGRI